MALQATVIMLAVEDLDRAKAFYGDGLGCAIDKDYPGFVSFTLGEGAGLALYQREAAAQDAGVSSEGSGFRGVSIHYLTDSRETVDEVVAAAAKAGGSVVKEPVAGQWGGYSGYFSDPDGYLWKVATDA